VLIGLLAALLPPSAVRAQTLQGQVLEDGRDLPVPGALVVLLDRDGDRKAETISDSVGRFLLTPTEAGTYVVEAVRLGFERTRSPLFDMKTEGSVPFEILLTPAPLGLPGLEVTVETEAERMLRSFGQSQASLGNRWVDREEIDEMVTPGLAKDIIRWQNIAGIWIVEYDDSPLGGPLCVIFRRRERTCALTVLDGAVVDPLTAGSIDTRDLEAIAILEPVDATTFYGTQAGGGAVLMWTRRGGGGR
jgi:hypothetical protein